MYIRQALELQAFLDMAKDEGTHSKWFIERGRYHYFIYYTLRLILPFHFTELMKGYKAAELESRENSTSERSLWTQCQSLADMKFTYVVSCQQYSIHKRSGDPRAKEILKLMIKYVCQINLLTCHSLCKHSVLMFQLQVPISSSCLHWWGWRAYQRFVP